MSDYDDPQWSEFAEAIAAADRKHKDDPVDPTVHYSYLIAGELIAAGYRKPRTITTAEELDALPVGSVVRSEAKTIAARLDSTAGVLFGMEGSFPWHRLALPATVLWEPTP